MPSRKVTGAGGNRVTVFEILDRGGQGDRPPEVRRLRLCCQDGSRGGNFSNRTRGADGHGHERARCCSGQKSAVPLYEAVTVYVPAARLEAVNVATPSTSVSLSSAPL